MKPLVFLVLINNVSSSSVVRSDSDIITLLFWVLPIDHNIQSCTKIYITISIQQMNLCQRYTVVILVARKHIILYEFKLHQRYLNFFNSFQCTFWQQFDFIFSIIYLLQQRISMSLFCLPFIASASIKQKQNAFLFIKYVHVCRLISL